MKIRNLIQKEFKIANQPAPKDREDYKAKMATIQDLQRNPKLRDPETQANIMKRKAELKTWAKNNLKKENFIEDAGEKIAKMAQSMSKDEFISHADELGLTPEEAAEHYEKMSGGAHAGKFEDADIDAQMKSDVLQFLNSKVVQIEKQIELAPANTQEEKENKEFALKLFNFVQAKLEQKDNGDNTIVVPKSFKKD